MAKLKPNSVGPKISGDVELYNSKALSNRNPDPDPNPDPTLTLTLTLTPRTILKRMRIPSSTPT
eukprot:706376-Amorphochlora_amoeboformis.AAC.1